MHTHFLRNSLIASALVCAFAAAPVSQVLARSPAQGSTSATAAEAMYSGATEATQASDNETMPGKANDGWITTKVKSKLAAAKNIKSTDISVDTSEGMVTLTGTVPTKAAKAHAERVARSVKGVKSVDATGLTVSSM